MQNLFPQRPPSAVGLTVQRMLGFGGSAQVWLVSSDRGERYALKCFAPLSQSSTSGPQSRQHPGLRRELRALKNFQHTHLIGLHDVVKLTADWSGMTGLLMDYAPGGSLAELLTVRGRLTVGETVTILTPIFQVLDYLHSYGVQHGDVSAGNVLFSAQGQPLLADLGLARLRGECLPTEVEGTAGFIDPARDRGLDNPSAADVYALSVLGWWCLSGRVPLGSPRLAPIPEQTPQTLIAALRAGLDPDPQHRPDAAALAREIFNSAPAAPIDLISSVHPSVLPQLITRRRVSGRRFEPSEKRQARFEQTNLRQRETGTGSSIRSAARRSGLGPSRKSAGRRSSVRRRTSLTLTSLALIFSLAYGLSHRVGDGGAATVHAIGGTQRAAEQNTAHTSAEKPVVRPPERPEQQRPAQLLAALCQLRAMAFRTGKPELFEQIDVSGSPAMRNDRQGLAQLLSQGQRLSGFTISIVQISQPVISTAKQLVMVARLRFGPYRRQTTDGVTLQSVEEQQQNLRFVLKSHNGKWLISEIFSA